MKMKSSLKTLLTRRFSRVVVALIVASVLVSCQKDGNIQPKETLLTPTVSAAKDAFAQYLQTLPKPRRADFDRLARQDGQRAIHWELAQSIDSAPFAGMRIPVSYPNQRTVIIDSVGNKHPLEQNTWLLAQDDTNGGYRFSMLTALPTGEYLARPGDGYSGVLEVTDWNGKLLTAYIYDHGRPRRRVVERQHHGNKTAFAAYGCG